MHFSKIVMVAMAAVAQAKSDAEILESHSQIVNVPIDEKRALTLKVSPTYTLDEVNSVTLKSFRKIVGYDTFDSIRRKDRNETKDTHPAGEKRIEERGCVPEFILEFRGLQRLHIVVVPSDGLLAIHLTSAQK